MPDEHYFGKNFLQEKNDYSITVTCDCHRMKQTIPTATFTCNRLECCSTQCVCMQAALNATLVSNYCILHSASAVEKMDTTPIGNKCNVCGHPGGNTGDYAIQ